jgi:hypothetical protein
LVETYQGRSPSGVYASRRADPTEVTLALREKGWVPYRIWFEPEEGLWVGQGYRLGPSCLTRTLADRWWHPAFLAPAVLQ